MNDNNDGMNNGAQSDGLNGAPMNSAPVNDAPATDVPAAETPVDNVPADNNAAADGGVVEAQPSEPVATSESASEPVEPATPTPAQDAPVQDTPAQDNAPASVPIATSTPTPVSTPDPVSAAGNGSSPVATAPKKSNSKLIVLVVSIVVILVAVIVALVVILVNNNNKGSKSKSSNKGSSSYYEEDEDEDVGIGGDWSDDSSTGSAGTISCFGYQFEKQAGYEYACEDNALGVHNSTFGVYLEPVSGLSYYQAEGHASELAANLGQQGTVRGYRTYTTSSGRKMLVFDMSIEGVNVYTFITAASSSSVLTGMVINASGSVSASDLEKADDILGGSTISSRLPEDGEEEDDGTVPDIDWNLNVLEF